MPYREGFVKNRYIGRTFIMPGQAVRTRSVRQKLNPMAMEFSGKNVLLVDDSIVRGTTSREIVQMARESGARKVFFVGRAAGALPNVYGIDMPTRAELIAAHRSEDEVAREMGADALIYQDLDALKDAVHGANPKLTSFETSCFDGHYITGDITSDYLRAIESRATPSAIPATTRRSAGLEPCRLIYIGFSRRFEPQLAGALQIPLKRAAQLPN